MEAADAVHPDGRMKARGGLTAAAGDVKLSVGRNRQDARSILCLAAFGWPRGSASTARLRAIWRPYLCSSAAPVPGCSKENERANGNELGPRFVCSDRFPRSGFRGAGRAVGPAVVR